MAFSAGSQIHPVMLEDRAGVLELFNSRKYVHRHPGWRSVQEWLQKQPFWVMVNDTQEIIAALACPIEPPGITWVRLFATRFPNRPTETWPLLFENVFEDFSQPKPLIAALGQEDWFNKLLLANGFVETNHIVILYWDAHQNPAQPKISAGLSLRQMKNADLIQVLKLDHRAFQPLWQISWESLSTAFQQSAYATVAELDGKIVGYQISTTTHSSTCLERLAVSPDCQNQGIGGSLVYDLIDEFQLSSASHLTVNTQQDNLSSQALYLKMGFRLTGESFPVFEYQNL